MGPQQRAAVEALSKALKQPPSARVRECVCVCVHNSWRKTYGYRYRYKQMHRKACTCVHLFKEIGVQIPDHPTYLRYSLLRGDQQFGF